MFYFNTNCEQFYVVGNAHFRFKSIGWLLSKWQNEMLPLHFDGWGMYFLSDKLHASRGYGVQNLQLVPKQSYSTTRTRNVFVFVLHVHFVLACCKAEIIIAAVMADGNCSSRVSLNM